MQRELLSEAMQRMELQQHEGLKFGSVLLDTGRGFVTGMASVCEELFQPPRTLLTLPTPPLLNHCTNSTHSTNSTNSTISTYSTYSTYSYQLC